MLGSVFHLVLLNKHRTSQTLTDTYDVPRDVSFSGRALQISVAFFKALLLQMHGFHCRKAWTGKNWLKSFHCVMENSHHWVTVNFALSQSFNNTRLFKTRSPSNIHPWKKSNYFSISWLRVLWNMWQHFLKLSSWCKQSTAGWFWGKLFATGGKNWAVVFYSRWNSDPMPFLCNLLQNQLNFDLGSFV